MNNAKFDVTAIGNAIVDVIAKADDALLVAAQPAQGRHVADRRRDGREALRHHGAWRGGVRRIGRQHDCRHRGARRKTAYIGKVADDQLGDVFTHDIRAVGVTYDTPPLVGGLPTARSLIFVTPDAQRTMQTFLGACTQLGPEDVNMNYVTSSKVVYLEGYLWDQPRAKQAMLDAAMKAQGGRRQGVAHAVGRLLRGEIPRRVPRPRREARRHSLRQRERDPVALPGPRTSTMRCSTCGSTARSRRSRAARRDRSSSTATRCTSSMP